LGNRVRDDNMAAAVIDRIVHHGRLLQFRGESYRIKNALMTRPNAAMAGSRAHVAGFLAPKWPT
jgi:hypothetical protein